MINEWACGNSEILLIGETEALEKTLTECHFFHNKSHIEWLKIEPRSPGQEAEA